MCKKLDCALIFFLEIGALAFARAATATNLNKEN